MLKKIYIVFYKCLVLLLLIYIYTVSTLHFFSLFSLVFFPFLVACAEWPFEAATCNAKLQLRGIDRYIKESPVLFFYSRLFLFFLGLKAPSTIYKNKLFLVLVTYAIGKKEADLFSQYTPIWNTFYEVNNHN